MTSQPTARPKESQPLRKKRPPPKKAKADSAKEEKDSKKASAEEKSGKDNKNEKDKKAEKGEKTPAKEVAAEGGEKKKKSMFFLHKNNVAEEKVQTEEKSEAQAKAKKEAAEEREAAKTKTEANAPPVFVPDDALISVLKDVSKALADTQNEQVAKLENENEKMILGLSEEGNSRQGSNRTKSALPTVSYPRPTKPISKAH